MPKIDRASIGWAFYDWAASAYALSILAGFYPIFYETYWSQGLQGSTETFRYGITVSIASFIAAVLAPVLGGLADVWGGRKRILLRFCGMGVISVIALSLVHQGQWFWASLIYIFGTVGYYGSYIAYNALLVSVSDHTNRHFISGMGYSLGYLGGLILFVCAIFFIQHHNVLGISSEDVATRITFIVVGLWWAAFTLPLIFWVEDEVVPPTLPFLDTLTTSLIRIKTTFLLIFRKKYIFWFILAYWFYIDGVNTVVTMATNYGSILGFSTSTLLTTLLIVQFVGVPCAIGLGWLGQRFKPQPFIIICILVYFIVVIFGSLLNTQPISVFGYPISKIYILGVLIGLVQGGLQSLSRSYYTSLIPKARAAVFFGFYNMIGQYAALLGPLVVSLVSYTTGNVRLGIASIAILFMLGLIFFIHCITIAHHKNG